MAGPRIYKRPTRIYKVYGLGVVRFVYAHTADQAFRYVTHDLMKVRYASMREVTDALRSDTFIDDASVRVTPDMSDIAATIDN